MQAQDYAGAKWALALRVTGATDATLDAAFNAGEVLRTHVLRPTWHLVTPADLRWLLQLTASRVHARNARLYGQFEIDGRLASRSQRAIARALEGRQFLTRDELARALAAGGIRAAGMQLAYILMRAELDAVICSGPRHGRQFTYGLLDERAPQGKRQSLPRDEALAELARRYFTSHGPATAADCAWWSGLTIKDVLAGATDAGLDRETIDGRTYWSRETTTSRRARASSVYLLPNYDEYLVSYRHGKTAAPPLRAAFPHHLVISGVIAGSWRRVAARTRVNIELRAFRSLTRTERASLDIAARAFGAFASLPVTVMIRR